jgi:hypothetical protein
MRIPFLLLLAILACPIANAQTDKLTPEEEQAVRTIRDRFNDRLDKEDRIEPLIPEMFVADFGARYAKEKKADDSVGPLILLASGLQFKKEVLDSAKGEDWQHARIATFNFMHVMMVPMMNHMIPSFKSGKEPEPDKLENDLNALIPDSVTELFAKDPVLANFIKKEGMAQPIATVDDLRRVSDNLDKGREMIAAKLSPADKHLSPESAAALKGIMNDKDFGPWLQIADRETYGFPKGTRFIYFFASPMDALLITKVGPEYKIVSAEVSSPD